MDLMTMRSTCTTRRTFVAASGICGIASAAGMAGVAGALADEAASTPADDETPSATAPIEPLATPESWDEEFDVVVVGSGGGLAGAVHAAELGASVLLVDKMPDIGGASKEASVWVVSGSQPQLDLGMPDLTDVLVEAALAANPFGARYEEHVRGTAQAALDLVNWTAENGFAWQPTTVTGNPGPVGLAPAGSEEGGMTARAVMSAYEFMAERLEADGGVLRLSATLEGLVMEDGAVLGVRLSDADGNETHVRATKGVLLATGGMGSNRAMLREYVPTAYECCKLSCTGVQDSGEGIRMGLGAGGTMDGFDMFMQFDGGIDYPDWNAYLYNSAIQIARQPWLGITRHGERYPYIPGGGSSEYVAAAEQLNELPGHEGFVFFDDRFEEYGPTFQQGMCRRLIDADTMPDEGRVPATLANPHWYDGVREAIADGTIASADTVEELAEKLGLAPEKVAAAVEEWNALCEQGSDPEGKMPDEFLYPIAQPPFYGMALGSLTFATHAGLAVGGAGEVLDANGDAIPGLYASGCAIGRPGTGANGDCCYAAATAWLAAEALVG